MFVEQRLYTCAPGNTGEFLRVYEGEGPRPQTQLAVTTRTRTPALPDVPTMIEQGVDYEVPYWTAIYAPAATPKPIVEKLAADIAKAMQDPAREPAEGCGNGSGRFDAAGARCLQPRSDRALSQDRAGPALQLNLQ